MLGLGSDCPCPKGSAHAYEYDSMKYAMGDKNFTGTCKLKDENSKTSESHTYK